MNTIIAKNKGLFILSVVVLIPLFVCALINYSIDRTLKWSLFPSGALIMVWTTIAPLFVLKKNKTLGLFLGLTITLIAYLFLIQYLVGDKDWFMPLALPIAILSLFSFGISLYLLTNRNINKFYAVAITVFLFGVIVNYGVEKIVDNYLKEKNTDNNYNILTIAISIIISLFLFVIGTLKKSNPNK